MPRRKTPRRRSQVEKNKYQGSFPGIYSPLLLACQRLVRLAQTCMPYQGASHHTIRGQGGDAPYRVPASSKGVGSSTSSAGILFCSAAGTFIPHASSYLQTGGSASGHPTVAFAPAWCLHTRIVPREYPGPSGGKERTGSGAGSEPGAGTEA